MKRSAAAGDADPCNSPAVIELHEMRRAVREPDRQDGRPSGGRLSARERLAQFLDADSLHEIETFRRHRAVGFGLEGRRPYTDGVVAGWGMVHGRRVAVYATDFSMFGGSLGEAQAEKIQKVMDLALSVGMPIVGINDGAGARIQEGVSALAGYGGIFQRQVRASGRIPQISLVLGPCAGGAAYSPALADFVFGVRGVSRMFITGPDVIEAVTGEVIDMEGLGGTSVHEATGVMSVVHDTEEECLEDVRYLLSLIPANNRDGAVRYDVVDPVNRQLDDITGIVPAEPHLAYDMREVLRRVVDDGELFEVHGGWARNVLCILARIGGQVVGIVANQPIHLAGVLDVSASEKAARFVTWCDSFAVPLVTFVDVPGFLPGVEQEHAGLIRHGAKLLYAYCNAEVPRIQVVVRKAYGGAYIVMDSRSVGCDVSYAWPGNEIAVMGAEAAVDIIHRRDLDAAPDRDELHDELTSNYRDELMHSFHAAERGLVDEVIDPRETRQVLAEALAMLTSKDPTPLPRRHGNPPL